MNIEWSRVLSPEEMDELGLSELPEWLIKWSLSE